ncbi:MAG: hypothetical protein JSW11_13195 [Candidatus Heimdallarchaeota archaeon]|nr:MAG: hypothetical protein JSW11_13195 [Candidatus Heimdallarchaeota archaeon]
MNDCTGVLKNITKAPMDLVRYFPIIILLYLFTNEIFITFRINISPLKFTLKKTGIVFFQDFHIWLAIFETFSIRKIQTSELKQLKHLKTFSLELDGKRKCVRIVLYSKSYKELEERIKTSKPILEVVLPDIHFVSKADLTKSYDETEMLKIGEEYILKEKSELLFPQFNILLNESSPSFFRMVLACDIHDEMKKKLDFVNCIQMYFFHSYDQTSFFQYLNRRFFRSQIKTFDHIQDVQELQRICLRYQTKKGPYLSFQEGLDHFVSFFSLFSLEPNIIETGMKQNFQLLSLQSENQSLNLLDTEKITSHLEMNQICAELCNYPNENELSYKEKETRCKKRAVFCQNLLENANFFSILESLINQKYITDKIHLLTELRRHLTYQQLICCISHLCHLNYPEIPYQKIVNLIHILYSLNYKSYKAKNVLKIDKNPDSTIFSDDGTTKHIFHSLAPN